MSSSTREHATVVTEHVPQTHTVSVVEQYSTLQSYKTQDNKGGLGVVHQNGQLCVRHTFPEPQRSQSRMTQILHALCDVTVT